MEEKISEKDKTVKDLQEKVKRLERPSTTDISVQVTEESISLPSVIQSNYVPNNSFDVQPSSECSSKLAQCTDNISKLPEEYKFGRILESSSLTSDFIPRVAKESIGINDFIPHQMHVSYPMKDVNSMYKLENPGPQWKTTEIGGKLTKGENIHSAEYGVMQNMLRFQNLQAVNCQYVRKDTQPQMCCVNVNILQNLNMKLQALEREKHRLQECFKQQRYKIEQLLQSKHFSRTLCTTSFLLFMKF